MGEDGIFFIWWPAGIIAITQEELDFHFERWHPRGVPCECSLEYGE